MNKDRDNQSAAEADYAFRQEQLRQMAIDMALFATYGSPEAMGVALFYLLKANRGEEELLKKGHQKNAQNIKP